MREEITTTFNPQSYLSLDSMNNHLHSLSDMNGVSYWLNEAVDAFNKEDFSALKSKLVSILRVISLEKEKGRELLRSVKYIKEMFRFYIKPTADSETRRLVLQIWVVTLEDDVGRGQCGLENMFTAVFELDCIETLARIAVSYVEDREEECLKLHNRYHYLKSKSTIKRRAAPPNYRKGITDAAVSKLKALVIFPAFDTVLSTLRSVHALICTYGEAERAMVQNDLGSIICKVLERHGTSTEVIGLCLKITKTALPSIYDIEKAHDSFFDDCTGHIHIILHYATQHMECEDLVETACSLLKNIIIRKSTSGLNLKIDVSSFVTTAQEKYPLNSNIEVDVRQLFFMLTHVETTDDHSHKNPRGRSEHGRQGKAAVGSRRQTEEEGKKESRKRAVRERTVPRPRRTVARVSTEEEMERRHTHCGYHHTLVKDATDHPGNQ